MKPSVNDFLDQKWIKDFFLDKEQIIANTELAAQLFSGLGYTHSKLLCCSILPISAWILESALRVSGLAGFHSISPAGHLLAWGRGEQERTAPRWLTGEKWLQLAA